MLARRMVLMAAMPILAACSQDTPPAGSNNLHLIENARSSGQPTAVEFGSDYCVSCRQMKVVMDAVAKRALGKGHVLVMDVIKDSSLQQPFRISMIPTQVFFDAQGNEIWRHMGKLTEDQVITRLGLGSGPGPN